MEIKTNLAICHADDDDLQMRPQDRPQRRFIPVSVFTFAVMLVIAPLSRAEDWKTIYTKRGAVKEVNGVIGKDEPVTWRVPIDIPVKGARLRIFVGGQHLVRHQVSRMTIARADSKRDGAITGTVMPLRRGGMDGFPTDDHPAQLDDATAEILPGRWYLQTTFADKTVPSWNGPEKCFSLLGDSHGMRCFINAGSPVATVVTRIDIFTDDPRPVIACVGDSITLGHGLTPGVGDTYPAALAKLLDAPVINLGGNGTELAALSFDQTISPLKGIGTVVLSAGINDIATDHVRTVDVYAATLNRFCDPARKADQRVIVCTNLPVGDSNFLKNPAREMLRNKVNEWMRKTIPAADRVDLDLAMRDPVRGNRLRKEYQCGDGTHPSARGAKKLAETVAGDLKKAPPQEVPQPAKQ